ncbi:hypothetical protein EMPS_04749 [Entomortierella parvispora]|uniref:RNI-like protein n=1 Tax=Entomortierella parvispora TaxID=205924 RepID=A0A9P3H9T3_9FUNG|nr:hypothetical protein EMPS_04749 [Entomortierella parvispora]
MSTTTTETTLALPQSPSLINQNHADTPEVNQALLDKAASIANLCRPALNTLALHLTELDASQTYSAEEILAFPLTEFRIPDELHDLPRRRSTRHELASAIAALLYPVHEGSLTAIIRYDAERVRLRAWVALQKKYDVLLAAQSKGHAITGDINTDRPYVPLWVTRIRAQGPWDPEKKPVSTSGVQAIPMPVQIAEEDELTPFFSHLESNGSHVLDEESTEGVELDGGKGEPHYGTKGAEFRKGVVYEDGRMDLCKMVVGPDHIWKLMESLRSNEFVRHFLLGNNIIGPSGAQAIAWFIRQQPDRMDTWYLAGNCIDGDSFQILVDAMVESPTITNVWMKRNPLGPEAAKDVFRLITETEKLRTLDLDQTELGDKGVTDLFNRMAEYIGPEDSKLPLRNLYLNGSGISFNGAAAIGKFLASSHCDLSSIYLSTNPLGDVGVKSLAQELPYVPNLTRLFLQSVGVSTQGAVALFKSLTGHTSIRALDVGQSYIAHDLGQAYNYIEDEAVPSILAFLQSAPQLEYFNLGQCAITEPGLVEIANAVATSSSMLYYRAESVVAAPTNKAAPIGLSNYTQYQNAEALARASVKAENAVRVTLEANVRARYGQERSYPQFLADEKRWLVSDRDVRKIDSVYRNRDMGLARRKLMTLVKDWEEGDDTLDKVMNACPMRRR